MSRFGSRIGQERSDAGAPSRDEENQSDRKPRFSKAEEPGNSGDAAESRPRRRFGGGDADESQVQPSGNQSTERSDNRGSSRFDRNDQNEGGSGGGYGARGGDREDRGDKGNPEGAPRQRFGGQEGRNGDGDNQGERSERGGGFRSDRENRGDGGDGNAVFRGRDDGNRGGEEGSRGGRFGERENRGDGDDRQGGARGRNEHDDRGAPAGGEGEERKPVVYVPPERPTDRNELRNEHTSAGINFKKYGQVPVQVSGNMKNPLVETFASSGLHPSILDAVAFMNYEVPTPIQKYCIPTILAGQDVMGCAQTGSGKTAGYLLPILSNILKDGFTPSVQAPGRSFPQCLVLCPTRELAMQVDKETTIYAHGTGLKSFAVYGQTDLRYMCNHLRQGMDIIAATTGRLKHALEMGVIKLDKLQYLVLDEADRMLDMGFQGDIEAVVGNATMPKKGDRLTLMFSATFPDEIQNLAKRFLRPDYVFIATGVVGGACSDVEQVIVRCENRSEKKEKLDELLEQRKEQNNGECEKTLIFVQTKEESDKLGLELACAGIPSTTIHGNRSQEQREQALADFKSGRKAVLVATNVAARGLDIPAVKHVINWDLPRSADEMDEYVHRIGRTGRVGNQGMATTFYSSRDSPVAKRLVDILANSGARAPDWLYEEAGETPPEPTGGLAIEERFGARDTRRFAVANTEDYGQRDDSRAKPEERSNAPCRWESDQKEQESGTQRTRFGGGGGDSEAEKPARSRFGGAQTEESTGTSGGRFGGGGSRDSGNQASGGNAGSRFGGGSRSEGRFGDSSRDEQSGGYSESSRSNEATGDVASGGRFGGNRDSESSSASNRPRFGAGGNREESESQPRSGAFSRGSESKDDNVRGSGDMGNSGGNSEQGTRRRFGGNR